MTKFAEQTIDKFHIPSFVLAQGDIVIIQLPIGPYFRPVELQMIDILTRKFQNENIENKKQLKYVEHILASSFWYRLFPMTIGAYLNKNANKSNPVYKSLYNTKWTNPKTKVDNLTGTQRRLLSLYATLSWTNNIIFDLMGVDPEGEQKIYKVVKDVVKSGGSAILFDNNDEFRNDCTRFIEAKYT